MLLNSAPRFVQLIRDASDGGVERHQLYRTLGVNVVMCAPPEDARRGILNEVRQGSLQLLAYASSRSHPAEELWPPSQVWNVITKLEDPKDYIMAADIWVEYPVKYFAAREVRVLDSSHNRRAAAPVMQPTTSSCVSPPGQRAAQGHYGPHG